MRPAEQWARALVEHPPTGNVTEGDIAIAIAFAQREARAEAIAQCAEACLGMSDEVMRLAEKADENSPAYHGHCHAAAALREMAAALLERGGA